MDKLAQKYYFYILVVKFWLKLTFFDFSKTTGLSIARATFFVKATFSNSGVAVGCDMAPWGPGGANMLQPIYDVRGWSDWPHRNPPVPLRPPPRPRELA